MPIQRTWIAVLLTMVGFSPTLFAALDTEPMGAEDGWQTISSRCRRGSPSQSPSSPEGHGARKSAPHKSKTPPRKKGAQKKNPPLSPLPPLSLPPIDEAGILLKSLGQDAVDAPMFAHTMNRLTGLIHGKDEGRNRKKQRVLNTLMQDPGLTQSILDQCDRVQDHVSLTHMGQILFALSNMHLYPSDSFLNRAKQLFLSGLNDGLNGHNAVIGTQDFSYRLHELSRFGGRFDDESLQGIYHYFQYLLENPEQGRATETTNGLWIARCLYSLALMDAVPPLDIVMAAAPLFCQGMWVNPFVQKVLRYGVSQQKLTEPEQKMMHGLAMFHLFQQWYGMKAPSYVPPGFWSDGLENVYLAKKSLKYGKQRKTMSLAHHKVAQVIGAKSSFNKLQNEFFVPEIGNFVDIFLTQFQHEGSRQILTGKKIVIEIDTMMYHAFLNASHRLLIKDVVRDSLLEQSGYRVYRLTIAAGDLGAGNVMDSPVTDSLAAKINDLMHKIAQDAVGVGGDLVAGADHVDLPSPLAKL